MKIAYVSHCIKNNVNSKNDSNNHDNNNSFVFWSFIFIIYIIKSIMRQLCLIS